MRDEDRLVAEARRTLDIRSIDLGDGVGAAHVPAAMTARHHARRVTRGAERFDERDHEGRLAGAADGEIADEDDCEWQ